MVRTSVALEPDKIDVLLNNEVRSISKERAKNKIGKGVRKDLGSNPFIKEVKRNV